MNGVSLHPSTRPAFHPGRRPFAESHLLGLKAGPDGPCGPAGPRLNRTLDLAVVLDAYSRKIVGWEMADHLRSKLVLEALGMAAEQRRPDETIHPSDQGSQYTAIPFGERCKVEGVRPSMGSRGDCYDNAMCESFFATLECELIERKTFETKPEACLSVFGFIPDRLHSGIGYQSPNRYEKEYHSRDHSQSEESPSPVAA